MNDKTPQGIEPNVLQIMKDLQVKANLDCIRAVERTENIFAGDMRSKITFALSLRKSVIESFALSFCLAALMVELKNSEHGFTDDDFEAYENAMAEMIFPSIRSAINMARQRGLRTLGDVAKLGNEMGAKYDH